MFDIFEMMNSPRLENEGVWRELRGGAEIKLARWGNDAFNELLRSHAKKHENTLKHNDTVAQKLMENIMNEVVAHTVIKDVRGLIYKGEAVTYTPALGQIWMQDRNFNELVTALCKEEAAYLLSAEEEALKKSQQPSSGSKPEEGTLSN